MNFFKAAIGLGFFSFLNLILAITFNRVRAVLWEQLDAASNQTGVYSQVHPHLANFEIVFWLLFIFSAIGAIAIFVFGAHREEYEEYRG